MYNVFSLKENMLFTIKLSTSYLFIYMYMLCACVSYINIEYTNIYYYYYTDIVLTLYICVTHQFGVLVPTSVFQVQVKYSYSTI